MVRNDFCRHLYIVRLFIFTIVFCFDNLILSISAKIYINLQLYDKFWAHCVNNDICLLAIMQF
jgi:hypothetical protein